MIRIFTVLLVISGHFSWAQFSDDFSDGDFTNNPTWTGQTNRFAVTSGELQLLAPAVQDESYLVTQSLGLDNGSWEFLVRMNFATSSTSYARIYLMSTNSDLTQSLSGYYVLIGETEDEISLFRQDGDGHVQIIDGTDKSIDGSSVTTRVKVTRTADGTWELLRDVSGGTNFTSEGIATDLIYSVTEYFGVYCRYTQSRSEHFFFDDFSVIGMPILDTEPPTIVSVDDLDATHVRIDFSEDVNPASVTTGNFSIDQGINISATETMGNQVTLTTSTLTNGRTYTLTVSGVEDEAGNEILADGKAEFRHLIYSEPDVDELVLTEVLFNPRSGGVDFVEIYNSTSDKYFNLQEWKLARVANSELDQINPISESELELGPGQYLALSEDSDILAFEYPTGESDRFFTVDDLPSYNDDAGAIVLLSPASDTVQLFEYSDDMHYQLLEDVEGVSLERIVLAGNENDPNVWRSAASTEGFATPGKANSQSITDLVAAGRITIEPKVFIPGNSGSGRDFTTISYSLDSPGSFANVTIYDASGRPVKHLARGASLSSSGFYRWDGLSDSGRQARMGYHIVVFEIYSAEGKTETIREIVVVGRDF